MTQALHRRCEVMRLICSLKVIDESFREMVFSVRPTTKLRAVKVWSSILDARDAREFGCGPLTVLLCGLASSGEGIIHISDDASWQDERGKNCIHNYIHACVKSTWWWQLCNGVCEWVLCSVLDGIIPSLPPILCPVGSVSTITTLNWAIFGHYIVSRETELIVNTVSPRWAELLTAKMMKIVGD